MDKCGIICEYNPFHNGHKYHLEKARLITGAQIVCVMSGDFTQRCHPAAIDKFLRAKAALNNGADAVIELPVLYSTAVGTHFAYGAVKILSQIEDLKYISFGVETDDTDLLEIIAAVQSDEPAELKAELASLAKTGLSYPNCLARATADLLSRMGQDKTRILSLLSAPNNVLAIEYLKAITRLKLKIKPIYVRRTDSGYNSPELVPPFAAAGAIRRLIDNRQDYSAFVPFNFGFSTVDNKIFDALSRDSLLKKDISGNKESAVKLKNAAFENYSLAAIIEAVKAKNYTYSGIMRQILCTLLDIDSDLYNDKSEFFFRVLGVKKSFKKSLKDLGKNALIRHDDRVLGSEFAEKVAVLDRRASDIYAVITSSPATRFFSKLVVE